MHIHPSSLKADSPQQLEGQQALVARCQRGNALEKVREQCCTPRAGQLEGAVLLGLFVGAAGQHKVLRTRPHCEAIYVRVLCGMDSGMEDVAQVKGWRTAVRIKGMEDVAWIQGWRNVQQRSKGGL